MNKQRLAILILAGLGGFATFMPWVKAPFIGSINGTKGDGWITLILYIIPVIISLLNDRTKALSGGLLYGAIVPAIIAGAIGLWKIYDFNSKMSGMSSNPFGQAIEASVSIEFGLYLVVLSGIALPLCAFLIKDK